MDNIYVMINVIAQKLKWNSKVKSTNNIGPESKYALLPLV
jgi:hypothetical protein